MDLGKYRALAASTMCNTFCTVSISYLKENRSRLGKVFKICTISDCALAVNRPIIAVDL